VFDYALSQQSSGAVFIGLSYAAIVSSSTKAMLLLLQGELLK